jgi:TonB family protein
MAEPVLALDPALAHAQRVLRRRSTGELLAFDTTREVGAGGEARILEVPGDPSLVAKIYRDATLARARKLGLMLQRPPALDPGAAVAWPVDLLTGPSGGRFAGFLMPRARGPRLFELYNPVSRRRAAPLFDYGMLHRAGVNLAAAFDGLHAHGYVVGDVNESNILVSPADAGVTLVDADSFQVRDPDGRAVFRSGVGKAEFTPPELQGAHFTEVDRAEAHDRFGLAVLLFLLLNEGTHPFASRLADGGDVPPVEERISRGLFPHARPDDGCRPPRLAPPFAALDPALQAMFMRAFVDGHRDPSARPAPAEWRAALAEAEQRLVTCPVNPRHRRAPHVDYCPWCHRARLLQGRDPFPATVDLARVHDIAPPPRRAHPAQAPPQPFAPAPPQPAPMSVMPAPPPHATAAAVWMRQGAATAVASLPAWMQPAFGPTALASPLVWMPPAALTCLFGATGGLRMLGLMVFFLALRQVFSAGMPRLRAATVFWAMLLLGVWAVVAGVFSGAGFAAPDSTGTPAAAPGVPVAADLSQGAGGASVTVGGTQDVREVMPRVINELKVARAAADAYPPELRARGISGDVQLRVLVLADGTPDLSTVRVLSSSDMAFAVPAQRVVGVMRFSPAKLLGRPYPRWTETTIHFTP